MAASDVQTVLCSTGGVTLCRFHCPADHDRWQRENRIRDGHNLVFPELPVEIRHAGQRGRIADSNLAGFYNHGDPYQRRILHPDGDVSNIFLFSTPHLLAALALDLGFANQSHFTEAFRREYGVPPGRLRRELRGAGPVVRPQPEAGRKPQRA